MEGKRILQESALRPSGKPLLYNLQLSTPLAISELWKSAVAQISSTVERVVLRYKFALKSIAMKCKGLLSLPIVTPNCATASVTPNLSPVEAIEDTTYRLVIHGCFVEINTHDISSDMVLNAKRSHHPPS
jgi:hypothetical protein